MTASLRSAWYAYEVKAVTADQVSTTQPSTALSRLGHGFDVHAGLVGERAEQFGVDSLHERGRGPPSLQALGELRKGYG